MEEPMEVSVARDDVVTTMAIEKEEDMTSQSVPSSSPAEQKIPVKKNDSSTSTQKKAASADRRDENITPVTSKKTKTSSSATSKTSKSATSDKTDKSDKTSGASSLSSKAKGNKPTTTTSTKGKRQAASPLKKRKIAEIEQEIQESDNRKAKLIRDKARVQKYLEEQARVIKFPIKDELVVSTDVHGKLPTPLPEAPTTLALATELAGDAIRVWDFLNTFRKQMSLNAISLNAFVDLLKFTGRASPALTEIYCAPLKLLLGDTALAGKLSAAIPKKLNFAHRAAANAAMAAMKSSQSSVAMAIGNGDDSSSSSAMETEMQFGGEVAGESVPLAATLGEFDSQYNGMRILPRKLRPEVVDQLTWQSVLRAVLLRLEPVKQLRKIVQEVPVGVPQPDPTHLTWFAGSSPASTAKEKPTKKEGKGSNSSMVTASLLAFSSSSSSSSSSGIDLATMASSSHQANLANALLAKQPNQDKHRTSFATSLDDARGSFSGGGSKMDLSLTKTASTLSTIPTGGASQKLGKAGKGPNKDALFLLTKDPRPELETMLEAAVLLETMELHALPVKHKLAALKAVCDACYETQRLVDLLERNAGERADRITANNKAVREAREKKKEASVAKIEQARQQCRQVNMAKAEKTIAQANKSSSRSPKGKGKGGKGGGKGAAGKGNQIAALEAALKKAKSNGGASACKGKEKDCFEPNATQLAAQLEDMILMEALGIDEVVDSVPDEELSDEEGDNEDNEGEDFIVNPDGSVAQKGRAFIRSKANDRKRQRLDREWKHQLITQAKEMLTNVLETRGEKEVKQAITAAQKAGLRYRDDDGNMVCTDLLMQVYKIRAGQEAEAKELRAASDYERALSEYCVRTMPIGEDRFRRRYWAFSHAAADEDRLFVECDTSLSTCRVVPLITTSSSSSSQSMSASSASASASSSSCADKESQQLMTVLQVCSVSGGHPYAGLPPAPPSPTKEGGKKAKGSDKDKDKDGASPDNQSHSSNGAGGNNSMAKLPAFIRTAASAVSSAYPIDLEKDEPLQRLIASRPSARLTRWVVYSSDELFALCEALDERGERERELKRAIQARFDVVEPPAIFLKIGNEHLGKKVVRLFGKKRKVRGEVIGWLPAAGDDEALWKIRHTDGDEEDLDEQELLESIGLAETAEQERLERISSGGDVDDMDEDQAPIRESLRVKAAGGVGTSSSSSSSSSDVVMSVAGTGGAGDAMDVQGGADLKGEPELVARDKSVMIGSQGFKVAQLGVNGLRTELLRVHSLLTDGLKRRGSTYVREGRKMWEQSVRAAEQLVDLRRAIQELEAVVRGVQEKDDEHDDEEVRKAKERNRKIMTKEGWLFDPSEHPHIGKHMRRFFKKYGKSDGVLVAYLPAEKNEGLSLWRMEHRDGDEEDLDENDVIKGIRCFDLDLSEDDEPLPDGEEEEEDEEEDDEDEEMEEEDDEGMMGGGANASGETNTLWPTSGVRARWLEALQHSQTVGEVALALSSFLEFARSFGVVDVETEEAFLQPAALERRRAGGLNNMWGSGGGGGARSGGGSKASSSSSSSSSSGGQRGASSAGGGSSPYKRNRMSSKRGGGSSSMYIPSYQDEGRVRRAAACAVKSYYEGP